MAAVHCDSCDFQLNDFSFNKDETTVTKHWHCVNCDSFYTSKEANFTIGYKGEGEPPSNPPLLNKVPFKDVKEIFEVYQRLCRLRRESPNGIDVGSYMLQYNFSSEKEVKGFLKELKSKEKELGIK